MKRRWTTILAAALVFQFSAPQVMAESPRPEGVMADVLVARPLCFVATVAGAAIFVVALPFAAIARNVPETAQTLVGKPASLTFCRRLGDFAPLQQASVDHEARR